MRTQMRRIKIAAAEGLKMTKLVKSLLHVYRIIPYIYTVRIFPDENIARLRRAILKCLTEIELNFL